MAHADGPREGGAGISGKRSRIAAVVLNYLTPASTRAAIASLVASERIPDQIIVVDNQGNAESRAAILNGLAGEVCYVATPANLGYSGGMNVGIGRALDAGAGAVLIVNSDATVTPQCLGFLEQALVADMHTGIAGPVIRSRQAPGTITSLGLRYEPRFGRMRDRAVERVAVATAPAIEQVDAVTGCVMLVRRGVFDAIGLLDEEYFFSFEDLDFGLHARGAGYTSVLVRAATAFHEGSRSIGPHSTRRLYFAARNHLRVGARMAPTPGRVPAAARFASIVALNAAHAVVAPGGSVRLRLRAVWRGTRDYMAGRFGDDRRWERVQDTGG
jgi:GT2 family glycosyltransferase